MTKPPKDTHLWHEVTKGIKPLKHRPSHLEKSPPKIDADRINNTRIREYFEQHNVSLPTGSPIPEKSKKLSKVGKIAIEARLDLHGLTRQEAQQKLQKFVALAHHDQLSWVLVITGKGHPDNPHTLRKLLPQWLDLMPLVTGYTTAKDQHGGQGAYYIRIKR
jgi:DNA-nicking Smr family endonuclease